MLFAPPELLQHGDEDCPETSDDKTDVWMWGAQGHSLLTCAKSNWHMAFDPFPVFDQSLSAAEQNAAREARIVRHQEEWVGFCQALLFVLLLYSACALAGSASATVAS